jgi:hypothetical protein
MLVAFIYTARGTVSEESEKRSLKLFTSWTPPSGFEFKSHYSFSDGTGGVGIAEVGSAAALLEATAPFAPFFEFKTIPVVAIDAAVPIYQKINAWRDSVR